MVTLIIPDVHLKYSKLLSLEPKMEEADRVVFLGDFFDAFTAEPNAVKLITTWLLGNLWNPKYTFLFGNHDHHYMSKSTGFSSGYDLETQKLLDAEMSQDAWRRFKVWTEVGPFVVSHAGFCHETIHFKDQAETAIEAAFQNKFHPLWQAGWSVGGKERWGGPTWLRWWELEDVGFKQIVGHTIVKAPEKDKHGNWNLDTNLRNIAWVDEEGNLTIEAV